MRKWRVVWQYQGWSVKIVSAQSATVTASGVLVFKNGDSDIVGGFSVETWREFGEVKEDHQG